MRLAALFLLAISAFAGDCGGDTNCYTLVYLPDAQSVHSYSTLSTFITSRKVAWNLKGVIGGGDVVNDGTGSYASAVAAYKAFITAGIPIYPGPGNHDYCNCSGAGPNNLTTRTLPATVWNNGNSGDAGLFAPDHRTDTYWAYGTDGANVISELVISPTRKLLIIGLELFARSAVLDWAQTIVLAHPNHEAILSTHAYMTDVGALYDTGTPFGPAFYGLAGPPDSNQATQAWAGWLSGWASLRMVWSGHFIAAGSHDLGSGGLTTYPDYLNGRLTANTAGHTVHQFFNNYQDVDGGSVQCATGTTHGVSTLTTSDFDHVTFIKFPGAGGYEIYDYSTATGVEDRSLSPRYTGSNYDHIDYPAGLWPLPSPVGR